MAVADDEADIPSRREAPLRRTIGPVLDRMVRYSWWPGHEASIKTAIAPARVFSLTGGPLLLYFDTGLVLGAASKPAINSVEVWVEKGEAEISAGPSSIESDGRLFPIAADDPIYSELFWGSLHGQRVAQITLLKRQPPTVKYERLPNEVGLVLGFHGGARLVLSHGLHNASDDFSVIRPEQISPSLIGELAAVSFLDRKS